MSRYESCMIHRIIRICVLASLSFPNLASARNLSFAIVGDAGKWTKDSAMVQKSILQTSVRNLIMPGDNLYQTWQNYEDVWGHWTRAGFRYSVVAIGNHNKSYKSEIDYFKMPGEYYSRTDGTARFIVLNSDNVTNTKEQTAWLDRELNLATEPFVFVVYHHPSFTVGGHSWQEKREFQVAVRPILLRYQDKITGLIVGHDHIASLVELNRLPLIVSGAVFESLTANPSDYTEDGFIVKTKWLFKGGFYWTRLDMDSSTKEVWVNFVSASEGKVSCTIRIAPRPVVAQDNCIRN